MKEFLTLAQKILRDPSCLRAFVAPAFNFLCEILHIRRKPYNVTFVSALFVDLYLSITETDMCCEPKILNVPIKPHLKKFLLKNTPEPFRIDEHTALGKTVISSLQKRRERRDGFTLNDRYSTTIDIELTARLQRMSPGISQLVAINTILDEMFQESLILWIFAQANAGVNPHNSCKSFLFFFNIDETEYTYDACYKTWQRHLESNRERVKKILRLKPKTYPAMTGKKFSHESV